MPPWRFLREFPFRLSFYQPVSDCKIILSALEIRFERVLRAAHYGFAVHIERRVDYGWQARLFFKFFEYAVIAWVRVFFYYLRPRGAVNVHHAGHVLFHFVRAVKAYYHVPCRNAFVPVKSLIAVLRKLLHRDGREWHEFCSRKPFVQPVLCRRVPWLVQYGAVSQRSRSRFHSAVEPCNDLVFREQAGYFPFNVLYFLSPLHEAEALDCAFDFRVGISR